MNYLKTDEDKNRIRRKFSSLHVYFFCPMFIFDEYVYDDRFSDFRLEKMQSVRNLLLTVKFNHVSGYGVT